MLICYLSNTTEFHCTSIKLYLLVLKSKRKFMFEKSIWQFIIIIHLAAFLQFINLLAFKFCSNKYSLTQTRKRNWKSFEILFNHFLPNLRFLPDVQRISIRSLPNVRQISVRLFYRTSVKFQSDFFYRNSEGFQFDFYQVFDEFQSARLSSEGFVLFILFSPFLKL